MWKQYLLSLLRHTLTFGGGTLVANGTLAIDSLDTIVGGTSAVVGVVMAMVDKTKK